VRQKALELTHKQTEQRMLIVQHSEGQDEFRAALERLISVASRVAAIFERSKK
jgi:hypothetical protein